MRRVAPEDEVVAALRRAGPDVRRVEAAAARPVEVGHEQLVVDLRARRAPLVFKNTDKKISLEKYSTLELIKCSLR